jgi:hypothetical protein
VDVGGGHHGLLAFRSRAILDAVEDSAPPVLKLPAIALSVFFAAAFGTVLGDNDRHPKLSFPWGFEDVLLPP